MLKSKGDKIFDVFNYIFMLSISFLALYPVWNCVIIAFNDGKDAMLGGIYWLPREFSLSNFKAVFSDKDIIGAFALSATRTVVATSVSVCFTAFVAYAFSKKYLRGRKIYLAMGTVTLFFSGGLIPTFLVVQGLGLYDNFLVYVLLPMFNFYYAILFMNFFKNIPISLEESAKLDGATDFTIFFRLIIPLSTPIIATITLYNAVFNWNDYFMGVMYTSSKELQPIQTFLYKIIAQSSSQKMALASSMDTGTNTVTSTSIKMATMVVTTVPIVCAYPFLQKYFVKGIMVGSVKE